MSDISLIEKHGGYRKLKSFQVAQTVYDVTVRFCGRYIDLRSRTHDQMVQAARSGVQNIAEGSQASGTSKKTELKLTNVARASLEELRLDYEDFLRQRKLLLWDRNDPRREELVRRRPATADEVAQWAKDIFLEERKKSGQSGRDGQGGQSTEASEKSASKKSSTKSTKSTLSTKSTIASAPIEEIAANGALTLIAVASALLDRQIASLAKKFTEEGGFTERMYAIRKSQR